MSPNIGQAEYVSFLDELAACVMRLRGRPSLVLGDFNAYATAWGSRRTNRRGREVTAWAAELDLRLVNWGSSSTGVAGRVHRGPHLGEPCRREPCLEVRGVSAGNIVGLSLHPDGCVGGKPTQDAGTLSSFQRSGAIAAVGRDPLQ
jgi:hypothetical protein